MTDSIFWVDGSCVSCIGSTLICWGGLGRSCRSGWGGKWVAVGTRMNLVYEAYGSGAEGSAIAGLGWVSMA